MVTKLVPNVPLLVLLLAGQLKIILPLAFIQIELRRAHNVLIGLLDLIRWAICCSFVIYDWLFEWHFSLIANISLNILPRPFTSLVQSQQMAFLSTLTTCQYKHNFLGCSCLYNCSSFLPTVSQSITKQIIQIIAYQHIKNRNKN